MRLYSVGLSLTIKSRDGPNYVIASHPAYMAGAHIVFFYIPLRPYVHIRWCDDDGCVCARLPLSTHIHRSVYKYIYTRLSCFCVCAARRRRVGVADRIEGKVAFGRVCLIIINKKGLGVVASNLPSTYSRPYRILFNIYRRGRRIS